MNCKIEKKQVNHLKNLEGKKRRAMSKDDIVVN